MQQYSKIVIMTNVVYLTNQGEFNIEKSIEVGLMY